MRKYVPASLALAMLTFALVPAPEAGAQVFDHLKCYKMKDPHNFWAAADLMPFQIPPFAVEPGCKIKVRGREFCIPVDKARIPGVGNAPSVPLAGQPLQNDYICYVVKCPKPIAPIPPVLVTDQFGSRTLQKFVATKLCTPAIKGLPPTTTSTTTTTTTTTSTSTTLNPCTLDASGTCNGQCPNSADTCLVDPATGACGCLPQSQMCAFDFNNGVCSGLCPNINDTCVANPPGSTTCNCLPLCQNASLPACNGTCPGTQSCVKDQTTTFCLCCGTGGTSCLSTADCCVPFTCIGGLCQ